MKSSASALICWGEKILLFHRDDIPTIPDPDCWQLPGGGIEDGETPEIAVRRELTEEVSFAPAGLKFLVELKRPDQSGLSSFVYYVQVNDEEAERFKHGPGEGQEIRFFTLDEARELKLSTGLRRRMDDGLIPLLREAMRTGKFEEVTKVLNE
ncbi:hypothetical protein A2368_02080 [Candidatus Collierbacteria bacterium RIFOXYB1_FULL_49_13]|uniref:Nudix hydrolase domain-containing protein n=1 Tax=Candidatus Collierbacteria bacterium RIFOXYB1_FULL_49_13 TaxID=1817728 RepID=A0A1F5FGA0_9BACT|nr:MAG: hypothetical protein A2368_02080 [Candidatus Collierbacteria bacterium RIFOXYB1_FULL_49_13]